MRSPLAIMVLVCGTTLASVLPSPGGAVTIHVPADQPTIQAGVDSASAGDTVLVSAGTYYDCTHMTPSGHLPCCVVMKPGICLRSETGQADCVTIHAEQQGRVLYCEDVDSLTVIEGFTLKRGKAFEPPKCGGGMFCSGSPPRLVNVHFSLNHAGEHGGGMYCVDSAPELVHCEFSSNTAYGHGAGFACRSSSPKLTECSFTANSALRRRAGGMYCMESDAELDGCIFRENCGILGGALGCEECSTLTLCGCAFRDNRADCGGAVFCDNSSPAFAGCTFGENYADYHGGAVYACNTSAPGFTCCVFCDNSALFDGGVLFCSHSSPTLLQSTLSDNSALRRGGGVRLSESSTLSAQNVIVAFSTVGVAVSCDLSSSAVLACSDLFGNAGGDWVGCVAAQLGQDGNISDDPCFCCPDLDDYCISLDSPCAPDNSPPGCDLIGALGVGCGLAGLASAQDGDSNPLGLGPPAPNPFNPSTTIPFTLPTGFDRPRVRLAVYDSLGRQVATLVDGKLAPGTHTVAWTATDDAGHRVVSGVYFCRLLVGNETRTSKLVLLQ